MGFDALLGNDRLKQNLTGAFARNRISHFYLISGPAGSGKRTLAHLLAAAALCTGDQKPCGQCSHCRKVMAGTHPDFITVDDPEKKTIPVELIRSARADIYIQPNEADRKVYMIPRAHDMQPPSQNALLKILEEPPAYGVFLLLADNPEKMLPTIRSRCMELALTALSEQTLRQALQQAYPQATPEQIAGAITRSGGYLGQAKKIVEAAEDVSQATLGFLKSYAQADTMGLTQVLTSMEKWKRDSFIEELELWVQALTNALTARSGIPATQPMAAQISTARSAKDLTRAIYALQKCIEYAQCNVSTGAICGYLLWELR